MGYNLFRTDLSTDITSYDLLKTFAIVTMIIDHLGAYFYPDIEELRLIGRLSMPVWFFLIGYADTRKLEARLWIGGVILLIGMTAMKGDIATALPLNILFTFLLTRALLNYVMVRATQKFDAVFGVLWLCALLAYPSIILFEYGSLGFLFAMIGYMVKHQDRLKDTMTFQNICAFTALSVTVYTAAMFLIFDFDPLNTAFIFVLLLCMCTALLFFQPARFALKAPLLSALKYPLFLTGRRTLEIYVLHLLAFMYIARYGIW